MHSMIWVVSVHFQRARVGFSESKAGMYAIWIPLAIMSLRLVSGHGIKEKKRKHTMIVLRRSRGL